VASESTPQTIPVVQFLALKESTIAFPKAPYFKINRKLILIVASTWLFFCFRNQKSRQDRNLSRKPNFIYLNLHFLHKQQQFF
jgi:hypothetical protein